MHVVIKGEDERVIILYIRTHKGRGDEREMNGWVLVMSGVKGTRGRYNDEGRRGEGNCDW